VDYLDHHLVGTDGGQHVLAEGLGLHIIAEILGHAVAHVGIQQGAAHLFERLRYIDFCNTALTFDYLE